MARSRLEGRSLTVMITLTSGVGFMLFGWDQGVFGGILGNQSFLDRFNNPTPGIQGQIVSTYDIGCILGAILSFFVGDRYGRKKAIYLACIAVFIGGAIQASAYGLAQMIVGRVVAGVGIGLNSATIPMWQAETSKPEHRGTLIAIQLVLVIFGIDMTQWVNLGMTYITNNEVSWRYVHNIKSIFLKCSFSLQISDCNAMLLRHNLHDPTLLHARISSMALLHGPILGSPSHHGKVTSQASR